MTEEEAKTKWCPHAVASHTDPRAGFRDDGRPMVHPCIGSACMAWRWDNEWTSATEESMGRDLVLRLKRKVDEPRLGYCGLADKP